MPILRISKSPATLGRNRQNRLPPCPNAASALQGVGNHGNIRRHSFVSRLALSSPPPVHPSWTTLSPAKLVHSQVPDSSPARVTPGGFRYEWPSITTRWA